MSNNANSAKMTKSERFKRLLPEIYKKLIKEGMKYDECAKWLLETHDLDMFSQGADRKPTLLATYMRLYGNLKREKKAYEDFLRSRTGNWWEDDEVDEFNSHKPVNSPISSPNEKQTMDLEVKSVSRLLANGNLSEKLKLSPDPKKNIPDPMAGYNPHKLKNKTNN